MDVRSVGGGYRRASGGHTQDEPPFHGLRPTSGWTAPLSPEPLLPGRAPSFVPSTTVKQLWGAAVEVGG